VTKLSLLLKVLEEETGQLSLGFERALPDLNDNIQCGNSVIGWDYFEGQLIPDEAEVARVNPFDWEEGFPQVFASGANGGFDAVIGNPPYVRIISLEEDKDYYKYKYKSASGAYDIYILFMERAIFLNKRKGLIGFITPNKYFVADYGTKLRDLLFTKTKLTSISDLGKCKSVFKDALISTAITIYSNNYPSDKIRIKILTDENVIDINKISFQSVPLNQIKSRNNTIQIYAENRTNSILKKIYESSDLLEDVANVRTGIMGFDYWSMDKYIDDNNSGVRIATNSYIDRYKFLWGKKVRLYKRTVFDPRLTIECKILNDNTLELFSSPKIVVRGVAKRLTAMYDDSGIGILVAVHSVIGSKYSDLFLLGLLNSRLFNWIHLIQFYSARIPEGSLRYPISFLSNLPIKIIDLNNLENLKLYDRMICLVNNMLELHKRTPQTPYEQERLNREIASTDAQIDRLIYDLYELTEEEIKIVEGEK